MCPFLQNVRWNQARREAGRGDIEEEVKTRSAKLNMSIESLKDCTTQILAQVAALAKVSKRQETGRQAGGGVGRSIAAEGCCWDEQSGKRGDSRRAQEDTRIGERKLIGRKTVFFFLMRFAWYDVSARVEVTETKRLLVLDERLDRVLFLSGNRGRSYDKQDETKRTSRTRQKSACVAGGRRTPTS